MIKNSATTLDQRRQWLLGLFKDFTEFQHDPKAGLPQALAKLAANGGDAPDAVEYASRAMDFRGPSDPADEYTDLFTYPGLARFLYSYGDKLDATQERRLKHGITSYARDLLDHGTENHAIMRITSAYLFAQYYPGMEWIDKPGGRKLTSAEMMAAAKALLLKRGKGFYRAGNNEVLSTTYSIVNIYPLLNLCDFARDPEVKAAAGALVLYHVAQLALNDFDGHIMPPFNRQNTFQARFGPPRTPRDRYSAIAQHIFWFLWGQNEVIPEDFTAGIEAAYPVFFALSKWRAPEVLDRIAGSAGAPYGIRSSIPFFGYWGDGKPDETLRTVWRDRLFAIGGGAQRFSPSGFHLSYSMFNIAWKSRHRFNYLECSQPYWRSNHGEEEWVKGATTPFQQMAVHKHTAIVLFDIPEKDPWPRMGDKRWTAERDLHYDHLIQLAQCRFPKSMDALVQAGDWYFLREGDVYIGIRVLQPGHVLRTDLKGPMADFNEIKSYSARTGFVFDVGTREASGSFEEFQSRLKANKLIMDMDHLDVSYTNSSGDTVRLKNNSDLSRDRDGLVNLVPQIWINGDKVDYKNWPVIESPLVTLKNGILNISQGGDTLCVDWSGELPVFTKRAAR